MLQKILQKNAPLTAKGQVADYIPELSKADPSALALGYTKEGSVLTMGSDDDFSLQSITKVFALLLALSEHGEEKVFSHVGYQGTHLAFNTTADIFEGKRAPNPMINSGAITVTSLLGDGGAEKLRDFMKRVTGYDHFYIDEKVAESEALTGHRNWAMGHQIAQNGYLGMEVQEALGSYFRQCAITTNIYGLTALAGFLGDGAPGLNPRGIDKARLLKVVTGVMISAGLYDDSAKFFIDTGVAAKSGVGGGVLAFTPNKGGYAAFGPALDEFGNSLAGVAALKDLIHYLGGSII